MYVDMHIHYSDYLDLKKPEVEKNDDCCNLRIRVLVIDDDNAVVVIRPQVHLLLWNATNEASKLQMHLVLQPNPLPLLAITPRRNVIVIVDIRVVVVRNMTTYTNVLIFYSLG